MSKCEAGLHCAAHLHYIHIMSHHATSCHKCHAGAAPFLYISIYTYIFLPLYKFVQVKFEGLHTVLMEKNVLDDISLLAQPFFCFVFSVTRDFSFISYIVCGHSHSRTHCGRFTRTSLLPVNLGACTCVSLSQTVCGFSGFSVSAAVHKRSLFKKTDHPEQNGRFI